jgi:glycosyltransferase involved in cell wall biosynthesis
MLVSSDLDFDPRVRKAATSAHQAGHDVAVFCRTAKQEYPFEVSKIPVERTHGTLAKLAERTFFSFRALRNGISFHPDIVHANDLDMLPLGWLLARRFNAKLVYDAHELWTEADRSVHQGMVFLARHLERWLARRADVVITVNDMIADWMAERLGIPTPNVILNAPKYQDIRNMASLPSQRDELGLGPEDQILLYHGRFVPDRGIEQLIRCMDHLDKSVHLVLRGFGSLESELRQMAGETDSRERIHFSPRVPMDELVAWATDADVGVIPILPANVKLQLAAPNKLFEYMMAGLPIAASDLPYIRRVVESAGVGLIFDPTNTEDMVSVLRELLSSQERLDRMSARSFQAASRYCWEHEYEKLDTIYASLAS